MFIFLDEHLKQIRKTKRIYDCVEDQASLEEVEKYALFQKVEPLEQDKIVLRGYIKAAFEVMDPLTGKEVWIPAKYGSRAIVDPMITHLGAIPVLEITQKNMLENLREFFNRDLEFASILTWRLNPDRQNPDLVQASRAFLILPNDPSWLL